VRYRRFQAQRHAHADGDDGSCGDGVNRLGHCRQRADISASPRPTANHEPGPVTPAPKSRPGLRLCAIAGLVGLVAYCDFPLQWVIGSQLSPLRAYISELSVAGQPASLAFRISDIAAGIGLAVLASVFATWRPTSGTRTGRAALTAAAVASIVDGASPMTCAPSIDQQCWTADHAGLSTQLTQLHTISGLFGFSAVLIAIVSYSVALMHRPSTRCFGAAGLTVATAAAALGGIEVGMILTAAGWTGLVERVQVCLISAWLASLAICVLRSP